MTRICTPPLAATQSLPATPPLLTAAARPAASAPTVDAYSRTCTLLEQAGGKPMGKTNWYLLGQDHAVAPLPGGGVQLYKVHALGDIHSVRVQHRGWFESRLNDEVYFTGPVHSYGVTHNRHEPPFISTIMRATPPTHSSLKESLTAAGFARTHHLWRHPELDNVAVWRQSPNNLVALRRIEWPFSAASRAPLHSVKRVLKDDLPCYRLHARNHNGSTDVTVTFTENALQANVEGILSEKVESRWPNVSWLPYVFGRSYSRKYAAW